MVTLLALTFRRGIAWPTSAQAVLHAARILWLAMTSHVLLVSRANENLVALVAFYYLLPTIITTTALDALPTLIYGDVGGLLGWLMGRCRLFDGLWDYHGGCLGPRRGWDSTCFRQCQMTPRENSHLFYIATHLRVRAPLRRAARYRLRLGLWLPRLCGSQGSHRNLLEGAPAGVEDVHWSLWLI